MRFFASSPAVGRFVVLACITTLSGCGNPEALVRSAIEERRYADACTAKHAAPNEVQHLLSDRLRTELTLRVAFHAVSAESDDAAVIAVRFELGASPGRAVRLSLTGQNYGPKRSPPSSGPFEFPPWFELAPKIDCWALGGKKCEGNVLDPARRPGLRREWASECDGIGPGETCELYSRQWIPGLQGLWLSADHELYDAEGQACWNPMRTNFYVELGAEGDVVTAINALTPSGPVPIESVPGFDPKAR